MVWIQLTVPSKCVKEPLDVGLEDAMDDGVVRLVKVLPQSVPEVERNFHHLQLKENYLFI